jgi:RimJ/RimL family protein N-acetyltransferase
MKLVPVSLDDFELYESCFCDPEHMSDLGGVQPREKVRVAALLACLRIFNCRALLYATQIPAILAKQVSYVDSDKGWVLKVVPEAQDLPGDGSLTLQDVSRGVGTVGLWEGEWKGTAVTEICWGIAPKFKGRKFGKMAVSLMLDMARADGRWGVIHVFTTVTNVASNALCVSCGFKYEGQETVDYDGRELFTNHYTLDTAQQGRAL